MGLFVDCQMAVVPWGGKANFKRARICLMRKGSDVYLAVFPNSKSNYKFLIDKRTVELLPAAIRLMDLEKDLFIRQVSDEQRYNTMMREIKVVLNRDKLRQNGKSDVLDKFLSTIPLFSAFNTNELKPSPLGVRIVAPTLPQKSCLFGFETGDTCDNIDNNGSPKYITDPSAHSQSNDVRISLSRLPIDDNWRRKLDDKNLKFIEINGLKAVPRQLWLRPSLQKLTLTDCNLTEIPKQLEKFASTLTFLDLSSNRIDSLPRTFCCKMNDLKLLNLSNNQIQTLPIEIKFFHRLVDLNISDNCLRVLPSTFSDLRSLRKLNVAKNNLSQLPAFRTDEIRLDYLDVSHNPLDGALNEANTFEVHPSIDGAVNYHENLFCPLTTQPISRLKQFPRLFEISMLNVVRCDRLLKLASEESLPKTIVSAMQRDIFKCYRCSKMNILPAYNSSDILDYVEQVAHLVSTGNYRHGMTFMKLICSDCFDKMRS